MDEGLDRQGHSTVGPIVGNELHQGVQEGTRPEPDDVSLVARAKSGEGEAFSLLVQRHGKAVLNLINKMIRDRTVVEDLWQDTFVRALENLATYEPRQSVDGTGPSFVSWLYRIAANLTLDELRRRGRWRMVSWNIFTPRRTNKPEGNETYEPPADIPDAQTILESYENIQRVRRALDTLPPEWRMILILREYQDLPYEEIADIISVPLGTVRSRLARAREQLRVALLRESAQKGAI